MAGQAGGETQQEDALFGIHLGEIALQLAEFRLLSRRAQRPLSSAADEFAGLGRFVAFVHNFIERHIQGAGPLFQGFDGRDGVAVFDARNVAAEKAGGFLDIALAEILFFAKRFESLSYLHY